MPEDIRHIVGQNIKRDRCAAGLSQEQLAKQLGIRRQHLSDWERGVHAPSQGYLKRLAAVLEASDWTLYYQRRNEVTV